VDGSLRLRWTNAPRPVPAPSTEPAARHPPQRPPAGPRRGPARRIDAPAVHRWSRRGSAPHRRTGPGPAHGDGREARGAPARTVLRRRRRRHVGAADVGRHRADRAPRTALVPAVTHAVPTA
jgi:hypothetical protein